ncbi:DNA endonuclease SmrA [Lonsdalea quercina]|uniref:DNA endonuclease SmrA n=1 Tax=Lonsdalea quercina TaxID=71657 RepID=UPI003974D8EC
MTPDEKFLFRHAVGDVTPLPSCSTKVHLQKKPALKGKKRVEESKPSNFLISGYINTLPLDEPLMHTQDGIQRGVLDKLRQGKYALDASLNLMRKPVAVCRESLFQFMLQAQHDNLRNLLIIHGKGRDDASHANLIRSYLARWLSQLESVQAFCVAQPVHGGHGACYVALRKSAQSRQENWERHAKRSR